jgi:hypothetical protein
MRGVNRWWRIAKEISARSCVEEKGWRLTKGRLEKVKNELKTGKKT